MDDVAVGRLIRIVRIRTGLRQSDLAVRAGTNREHVSLAEHGRLGELRLAHVRAIAAALEIRLALAPSWRGGDADRVVNELHTALQQWVCGELARFGWACVPEATFSIFGERGSIDVLAWHADSATLLVVEVKTEVADPARLAAQVDRYRRLAVRIGSERGWRPKAVGVWVVVADTELNRRRLRKCAPLLRPLFPTDGRSIRPWIREPRGEVSALSFMSVGAPGDAIRNRAQTRRVRRARRSGAVS